MKVFHGLHHGGPHVYPIWRCVSGDTVSFIRMPWWFNPTLRYSIFFYVKKAHQCQKTNTVQDVNKHYQWICLVPTEQRQTENRRGAKLVAICVSRLIIVATNHTISKKQPSAERILEHGLQSIRQLCRVKNVAMTSIIPLLISTIWMTVKNVECQMV